jgi:hypothetical protein
VELHARSAHRSHPVLELRPAQEGIAHGALVGVLARERQAQLRGERMRMVGPCVGGVEDVVAELVAERQLEAAARRQPEPGQDEPAAVPVDAVPRGAAVRT